MYSKFKLSLYEKVLVFGANQVGKTSLIRNIEGKSLKVDYYPSSDESTIDF